MFKTVSLAAAGALLATAAGAAPVKWSAAQGGNDHYYEFINSRVTASAALAAAEAATYMGRQGHLVTITSAAEQAFLNGLNTSNTRYWLGGSDRETEGVWKWISGPEAGQLMDNIFTNWAPNEPNDYRTGEDYMTGWWRSSGQWNDLKNGSSVRYIIEYSDIPAAPIPSGLPLLLAALGGLGLWQRKSSQQSL